MKKTVLLLFILAETIPAFAQKWSLDNSHSSIQFAISHMVISETTGKFSKFSGDISSSKADFSDLKIDVNIEVASIDTDDEKRDAHLKGADFFDAPKYPKINYKSTSVKVNGKDIEITGNLTMKGVTKVVVLKGKYLGTVKDPWGNTKAGFKMTTTINRKDYGITYGGLTESGGLVIGDEVDIVINVELKKEAKK